MTRMNQGIQTATLIVNTVDVMQSIMKERRNVSIVHHFVYIDVLLLLFFCLYNSVRKPSAPQSNTATGGAMIAEVKVRTDESGNPAQDPRFGTCKLPGCSFPRRVEKGYVHDFCSRACSRKFSSLPGMLKSK